MLAGRRLAVQPYDGPAIGSAVVVVVLVGTGAIVAYGALVGPSAGTTPGHVKGLALLFSVLLALIGFVGVYPLAFRRGGVWEMGFRPPPPEYSLWLWFRHRLRSHITWDEVEKLEVLQDEISGRAAVLRITLDSGEVLRLDLTTTALRYERDLAVAMVRQWSAKGKPVSRQKVTVPPIAHKVMMDFLSSKGAPENDRDVLAENA